ncbi:MAG: HIT domain-containing protein [Candidatus Kapabacteria bacterium]|nr:HIT domain-containing protein [Candidatus Kapabacteria bacterium]MCS7170207.1 HIT domain-containing protein [Candidatus Kapabacteria bacterium]MDW7996987.1 HIT domain-containing protein [Bacteroidota bacterium]MDW8225083.1 HIT domain-containing protein [Bacteroidota bacterium]
MERLWAPWRSQYVTSFAQPVEEAGSCFLCEAIQSGEERDAELFIVARWESCFAILNRYPYNSGHVMIAPRRHAGLLEELTDQELCTLMLRIRELTEVLRRTLAPHGFNIGLNIGRAAGAGLPEHLHVHVVPRWHGDTNFLPVTADVKVVSHALEDVYEQLRAELHR